jgi:hypothetical protein
LDRREVQQETNSADNELNQTVPEARSQFQQIPWR